MEDNEVFSRKGEDLVLLIAICEVNPVKIIGGWLDAPEILNRDVYGDEYGNVY